MSIKTKKANRIFTVITLTILIGVLSFFAHQLSAMPETQIGLAPEAITRGVEQLKLFSSVIVSLFSMLANLVMFFVAHKADNL